MRIIAGTMRGTKLSAPEGLNTRPTLDRVREAIFSMLMPYLVDSDVLDLFAGSGAMGLEALSRGANKSVFVDCDISAISCINSNIKSCKLEDKSFVSKTDSVKFLSTCKDKFDIIFLDPPYFENIYESVLNVIYERELLSEQGIVVVEWDFELGFIFDETKFELIKEKKYGRVGVTTLKRGNN